MKKLTALAPAAAEISTSALAAPETYVIDKNGVIRHKHTGPLDRASVEGKILPLVRELQQ